MLQELAIEASSISKSFAPFSRPADRLKRSARGFVSRIAPGLMRSESVEREDTFWALRDVNFSVKSGETVGIIGRNGSGKSTLLQIVCGTLAPTTGTLEVRGRVGALLELGSGFDVEYTGRENIYLNAQLYGLTRQQIDERYNDIVAFADIGDFVDQPVKTYSSGMFVRLAFAVIAHIDADILVIDEALAVGDAFFNQKCFRFLHEFKQNGTILFVSHDTATIKKLCSKVVWIDHGRVMGQGDPDEVCKEYLEARYSSGAEDAPMPVVQVRLRSGAEHDVRRAAINASPLRNDMEILPFNRESQAFGSGGAQIVDVALVDEGRRNLTWVVGGEQVTLLVSVLAAEPLKSPIVGFFLKNDRGQELIGDNTFRSFANQPVRCMARDLLSAEFSFVMPVLPPGDFSINVAVAEGTQYNHVQLHWIHDALPIKVHTSRIRHTLIGIPMHQVSVSVTS